MFKEYGLIGAGRGCYEIVDIVTRNGGIKICELWDENKSGVDKHLNIKINNMINPDLSYIITPGDPIVRKILYNKTKKKAIYAPFLLGKNTHIGSRAKFDEGLILQDGAIISCDVKVGKHVFLNFYSVIAHDSTVGDFSFLGTFANMMGYSKLGEGVLLGSGALVLPDVEIGDWSVIGAGAVVNKNVPSNEVWVGNPARFLRKNGR